MKYVLIAYTLASRHNDPASGWFIPHTAAVALDEEHEFISEYREPAEKKLRAIVSEREGVSPDDVLPVDFTFIGEKFEVIE